MSSKQILPTPLLSSKHNGIPDRLYEKAQQAKAAIHNIATKAQSNGTQIEATGRRLPSIRVSMSQPSIGQSTSFRTSWAKSMWKHVELVTKLCGRMVYGESVPTCSSSAASEANTEDSQIPTRTMERMWWRKTTSSPRPYSIPATGTSPENRLLGQQISHSHLAYLDRSKL